MCVPAILIFNILFISALGSQSIENQKPLQVAVYYESLCQNSADFITKQLYPNFAKLEAYTKLELIPFGKAKADNKKKSFNFHCQHGPKECYGNKVQACVINRYNARKALNFVKCAMASDDASSDKELQQCAAKTEVNWDLTERCVNSTFADKLILMNAKRTWTVSPRITYVPTITFNNHFNKTLSFLSEDRFFKTACNILKNKPKVCTDPDDYEL